MRIGFKYAGEDWAVKFDGIQFIPYRHKAEDLGEGTNGMGYYKSFGNAIEKIIKTKLGEQDEITDLRGFIERFEKAVDEIRSIVQPEEEEF